jgi:hypothetical protein
MTLDMGLRGEANAEILLLCLDDEGSFVSALALLESKRLGNYARLGLAYLELEDGTRIEEWKLRTVILR